MRCPKGLTASIGLCEKYSLAKYRCAKSSGMGSGIFKQEHGGADSNERHKSSLR